ncbi:MAG: 5'-methylthioadenosine/adenosylhomocysteine nucleosidase [Lactobacillus sp.]
MKIAIIVPMEIEAAYYRKAFQSETKEMFGSTAFEHFYIHGNEIYLGLSGIGKVNAAMNLTSLLTAVKVDLVFITGSAGSLQADSVQGDLILPDVLSYHDANNLAAGDYVLGQIPQEPVGFQLISEARAHFMTYLLSQNVAFKTGLIVTGDSFIASNQQRAEIKRHFPAALGVEMEGAAFAQVASHFNCPLIVLRAISDNGDDTANTDFITFVKQAGARAARLIVNYLEGELHDRSLS